MSRHMPELNLEFYVDRDGPHIVISHCMKIQRILVVIALSLSVLSPLSVSISPLDDHSYIMTLDVCNASGSALSVNADAPALLESSGKLCPLAFCGHTEVIYSACKLSLLSSQLERPPRS